MNSFPGIKNSSLNEPSGARIRNTELDVLQAEALDRGYASYGWTPLLQLLLAFIVIRILPAFNAFPSFRESNVHFFVACSQLYLCFLQSFYKGGIATVCLCVLTTHQCPMTKRLLVTQYF